jgi:YggT family protein
MALRLIGDLIELYLVVLFVRIMFTWFPITPGTSAARVEQALGRVTDPLLSRVRRIVPPVRFGAGALDLSPMIIFVVLLILLRIF